MKEKQPVRTFIIQNKMTKQQWKARSGKVAWKNKAAAKNAFANVENLVSTFKEIEDNAFILTEEHKEFISNFISNFGG